MTQAKFKIGQIVKIKCLQKRNNQGKIEGIIKDKDNKPAYRISGHIFRETELAPIN